MAKAWFGPGYLWGIIPRPLNARAWAGTLLTLLLAVLLILTDRYENRLIAGGLLAYYFGLVYAIAAEKLPERSRAEVVAEAA